MTIEITGNLLRKIQANGEAAYPEEGAGLLLGHVDGDRRQVSAILELTNAREDTARHNRYLIIPQDVQQGELEAERLGLDIIGVFHSHPDHPNQPSEYDREWAMVWYSYMITSIDAGKAAESRSWKLEEDHSGFEEEKIELIKLK